MQDTFQWTDQTAAEFARYVLDRYFKSTVWTEDLTAEKNYLGDFKSSKAPKKEWEIVAYQHNDKLFYTDFKDDNGRLFARSTLLGPYLEEDNPHKTIHSVRRLSDGAMFVLNERVCGPLGFDPCYIKSFSINNGCVTVYYENNTSQKLEFLQKLPSPVLTTVDGVEVTDFNNFFPTVLFEDGSMNVNCERNTWENDYAKANGKLFSTREAAEKYIIENRPVLSLNDVLGVFPKDHWMDKVTATEKLTALVKQKLNQ